MPLVEPHSIELAVIAVAMPGFCGVLWFLIKRMVSTNDETMHSIAADIKQLVGEIGDIKASQAVTVRELESHDRRIGGLEDRERGRMASAS